MQRSLYVRCSAAGRVKQASCAALLAPVSHLSADNLDLRVDSVVRRGTPHFTDFLHLNLASFRHASVEVADGLVVALEECQSRAFHLEPELAPHHGDAVLLVHVAGVLNVDHGRC